MVLGRMAGSIAIVGREPLERFPSKTVPGESAQRAGLTRIHGPFDVHLGREI